MLFTPPCFLQQIKRRLAFSLLLLSSTACSSPLTADNPVMSPSTSQPTAQVRTDASVRGSSQDTPAEFKANGVILNAAAFSNAQGFQELDQFKLPEDIDISQVSVVQANLDGRDIDIKQISLDIDDDGNILFFLSLF